MPEQKNQRLIVKVTRDTLPQVKDRYPFLYLERGRLEVDDSSIKWIDSDGEIIRLPIATIGTLLLGPGTSITHEAMKVLASANCTVCWVGEDSLLFYAVGNTPTADTRNLLRQIKAAYDKRTALAVARRMFSRRFPQTDVSGKSLAELMGMEGCRVKSLYQQKAEQYGVGWKGRVYVPGKMELSDITNKILTLSNNALYALLNSCIYSLGYSPHIGFVHSGSPLPFVYDMADLYKEHLTIDLAFKMTLELAGQYDRYRVANEFKNRVLESDLMGSVAKDIDEMLG